MTDGYGELGVLASGGPCTAFCAAVRDNMPIIGSNPEDSVVRVAGAVHASDVHNLFERVTTTSGVYPAVLAFDADGQYIGHSDEAENEGNPSGDFVDVVVHQAEPGPIKQTTYLQISHDSPMCLSYVLQTVVDGIPAIWIGDVGRICGKEWYYSDTRMYVHSMPFLILPARDTSYKVVKPIIFVILHLEQSSMQWEHLH